jgi:hypothetical protein
MNVIQLELDFRSANSWCEAFAHALAEPEGADLRMLWRSLEPELLGLSQKEQLQVAGQALCDLAEVCQRRADLMWDEWVDQHNTDGPIPDEDFLAGLVQKSMFLDISGLVKQPKSRRGVVAAVEDEGESVVAEVTKETALLLAGAEVEEEPLPVAVLEHDEDIAAWVEVIRLWMNQQVVKKVVLAELLNGVNLPSIKCWLGILLGGFEQYLNETKGFYDLERVTITLPITHHPGSVSLGAIIETSANR